jgi:hypothetical protein
MAANCVYPTQRHKPRGGHHVPHRSRPAHVHDVRRRRSGPPTPRRSTRCAPSLLESKEKNRGVTLHVKGGNIGMVVTGVDDQYVIGRSQTTSRIVVRMERIDGVSAMF